MRLDDSARGTGTQCVEQFSLFMPRAMTAISCCRVAKPSGVGVSNRGARVRGTGSQRLQRQEDEAPAQPRPLREDLHAVDQRVPLLREQALLEHLAAWDVGQQ